MHGAAEQHNEQNDPELQQQGLRREPQGLPRATLPPSGGDWPAGPGISGAALLETGDIEALSTMSKMLPISSMPIN